MSIETFIGFDNLPFTIPPMIQMGERITESRKKLGLTQDELGDHLGVTRVSVGQWEADRTLPKVENVVKMSEIFRCDPAWLIFGGVQREGISAETERAIVKIIAETVNAVDVGGASIRPEDYGRISLALYHQFGDQFAEKSRFPDEFYSTLATLIRSHNQNSRLSDFALQKLKDATKERSEET